MRRSSRALSVLFVLAVAQVAAAQQPIRVALLDFGKTSTARSIATTFAAALSSDPAISVIDRDLARMAARGVGYADSLNLSLAEAQDLGAAIGCEFLILGDVQTLRRQASSGPAYFESYASLFLVSARSGRLVNWQRPSFQAAGSEAAEALLLAELAKRSFVQYYLQAMRQTREAEQRERALAVETGTPVIEDAGEATETQGLRLPRPYRRMKPPYPDSAAQAGASGTVDVLVDLDKEGEITRAEVVRWAGFGLDESTISTVRQMHFFPAMRDGVPIPLRVLLRYNFRDTNAK